MATFPPWQSCPVVSFNERPRTQAALFRACLQFDVAHSGRYARNQQGHGETYCNIFAWDVTRALGCEIPHWVDRFDPATGARREWLDELDKDEAKKRLELSARGCILWLRNEGEAHGWRPASRDEAAAAVVLGHPTVVTWEAPKGPSHIAVVLPPLGAELRVAQAGALNGFDLPLPQAFGGASPLEFWVHQ